jgi:transcriptional regulator with XRE-family HTH domain
MKKFGQRLKELREECKLSQEQLADRAGISRGLISQAETGLIKTLAGDNLVRVAKALGTTAEYLVLGIRGGARNLKVIPSVHAPLDIPRTGYVIVPRVNWVKGSLDVCAGDNGTVWRADFIRENQLEPAALISFDAGFDEMESRIGRGDTVLVDTSKTSVEDGRVYAVAWNDELRVRRIFKRPTGGLILHADNPKHPAINLAEDEMAAINIVGRVVNVQSAQGL